MQRRLAARESRHRQIHAAPEQVHRTAFANEASAENLEHPIGLRQGPPESIDRIAVVRPRLVILGKWHRDRQLVGFREDVNR
jgi:hypothetical protein